MENANKVFSFVLGLIVVIVLLVVLTGRFNLRERFLPLSKNGTKTTISPTPKNKKTLTPTQTQAKGGTTTNGTKTGDPNYQVYKPSTQFAPSAQPGVVIIPKTGVSTLLLPITLSAFLTGIYLTKRRSK